MSDPLPSVDEFLRLAHLFAEVCWPGSHPVEVRIVMIDGSVKPLAMLGCHSTSVAQQRGRVYEASAVQDRMTVEASLPKAMSVSAPASEEKKKSSPPENIKEAWEPNVYQIAVLESLEFRALRTKELIQESGVCRGKLYAKPGGMDELRERNMVKLSREHGYYRPDAPPEELLNDDA